MDVFRNVFFIDLIAIFRIKTYEDFDTNVPLMGLSFDVYHFMEKKTSLGLGEIGIYICSYKWANESVGTHIIWEEVELIFLMLKDLSTAKGI